MEGKKRCLNCGRYPFCSYVSANKVACERWTQRNVIWKRRYK